MKHLKKTFLILVITFVSFIFVSCAYPEIVAHGFQDFARFYENNQGNSWEPRTKIFKGSVEVNGHKRYAYRQVKYGETYPNSYMDIYYVDENPELSKNKPLLVFMHGGCFWWGDCTTGNPVVRTDLDRFIERFNNHGYNVVIIDYAFTPEYIFPVQLTQMNQALNFIRNNANDLNLSFANLFLGGNSAGAIAIAQYAALISNESYRNSIHFEAPAVSANEIRGVEIDDGFWDWVWIADPLKICAGVYMNRTAYLSKKQAYIYDATNHITENYPAACIVNGVFTHDSYRLYDTLQDNNCESIIIDGKGQRNEIKTHCYLITDCSKGSANVDADFDKLLSFFDKQLK